MIFVLTAVALASFVPARIILGASDPEMMTIRGVLPAGIEIVEGCGGARDGAYSSTVSPRPGDVWIECAPAEGGREAIVAAGGLWIDHHRAGDVPAGTPAFEASSLGQICRLFGIEATPALVAAGEVDHDFPAFIRGDLRTPKSEAEAFVAARRAAFSGVVVTPEMIEEVLAIVATLPVVDGHYDGRACGDLTPATLVPGPADPTTGRTTMIPVPGTGGRLGSALFSATGRLDRPVINWGAQGVRAQGRNVAAIGPTTEGSLALLARIGAVGIYGTPGRACGGYIPV